MTPDPTRDGRPLDQPGVLEAAFAAGDPIDLADLIDRGFDYEVLSPGAAPVAVCRVSARELVILVEVARRARAVVRAEASGRLRPVIQALDGLGVAVHALEDSRG